MPRIFTYVFTVFVLLVSLTAHAVSNDFNVNILVGDDTTPPSIPTNLTATPVAISQIDLAWSASTDDVLLSGYQVFRDGSQIATTTLTSYSDVGLTPSTTYTYYVTAFDSSFNVSASSTEVSTTTLASTTPPATTTPQGGGGGEKIELEMPPVEIVRLEVIPDMTSAVIRYETRGYVRAVIKWGKTISYELGSLAERSFSRTHETVITGLAPNTAYTFVIEGENHIGIRSVMTTGTFTTLSPVDDLPPANVTDLRAVKEGDDIVLTWRNPEDPDFDRVRILRSDLFYPGDTADGWLVYESDGETLVDRGMAVPNTTQYYTVFSYDDKGNISSGAVVALTISDDGTVIIDEVIDETNPLELDFKDLEFIQEGRSIPQKGGGVSIDGTKQLTVRIAYERLPEHLKTILITLTDRDTKEKTFSFLLRIDAQKQYYTATLAPFGVAGVFPLRVTVFDFKTQQIGYAQGDIISSILFSEEPRDRKGFIAYMFSVIFSAKGGFLLLFVLVLLLLSLYARRLLNRRTL